MGSDSDPGREYASRLEARRRLLKRHEDNDRLVAVLRLVTAICFGLTIWLSFWRNILPRWSPLVAIAIFFALVLIHEKVVRATRRALKSVRFYEDGLARIEDRWIGRGQSTEIFRDDSHLYAADLDIFGKGSLFELLCTARMRGGEEMLAAWLAGPANPQEIIARQDAIRELRDNIDLREDLTILGGELRSSIHPKVIIDWGNSPAIVKNSWIRLALPVPVIFAVYTLWPILTTLSAHPLWWLALGIEAAIGLLYRSRVREVIEGLSHPDRELKLLSLLLARIEQERFKSAKLVALRAALETGGLGASRQIKRFTRLMDTLNWYRNEFFAPFSVILLWRTQFIFAMENWKRRCGPSIGPWIDAVGEIEALCALAGFAYEHPSDPFPEIVESGAVLEGEDLRHPLIASAKCVPNSVRLANEPQLLVVSGSNMSGKSTLLRTVGINAVLAMAGAPVRARRLRLSCLAIGATLRIQDSLQAGTSRFYAEIQRIHHIMELSKNSPPVLFLLDEVLHGTNSHDRAIGAEAIVNGLIDRGAIGLATTHDLALARVADALAPRAANVHFEDDMVDGKIVFDYRMRAGVVHKSNALALMRAVGLEV
jgi:MutS-like protein